MNISQISGTVFLDFSKAFDLVNHNILLHKLQLYLNNSSSLAFFQSFLNNRKQKVFVHGSYSSEGSVKYGVPQGSVLGPILFCIYINDLPLQIQNTSVECHMLADDTTIQTQDTNTTVIQKALQSALCDIESWCTSNHMVLNPKKSKSMLITTRQKHQLSPLSLNLSTSSGHIDQVSHHRHLGVIIDDKLTWHPYIEHLCKLLGKNLHLLSKLRTIISHNAKKVFYHAHIKPHIDYASVLWDGASDNYVKKVDTLHRRAARLIYPGGSSSILLTLKESNILPFKEHLRYNKAVTMHKILNNQAPEYLVSLFNFSQSPYSYHKLNLSFPKPRLDIYKTSLAYSGVSVWNSLPIEIRSQASLKAFKKMVHSYLMSTHC
jgi:hypothetical protein